MLFGRKKEQKNEKTPDVKERAYYEEIILNSVLFTAKDPFKYLENDSITTVGALVMLGKYLFSPERYESDFDETVDAFARMYGADEEMIDRIGRFFFVGAHFGVSPYILLKSKEKETLEKERIRMAIQAMNIALTNEDNKYFDRLIEMTEHIYNSPKSRLTLFEKDVLKIVGFVNNLEQTLLENGYIFKQIPVISWETAIDHVGETVTIEGPVVSVPEKLSGKQKYIDIGEEWPSEKRVACVVWEEDMSKFANCKDWQGKVVRVHGKVEQYKGVAQIVVRDAKQITVV